MKSSYLQKYLAPALASALCFCAQAQGDASTAKVSVEDEILVSTTATVQAVDLEKRELTLRDPLGDVKTVTVDKAVKRLNEIKVGDDVTAKYYISLAAELRQPTEEEKNSPLMV